MTDSAFPAASATAPSSESATRFAMHWAELKLVGWLFGALLFSSFALGMIGKLGHTSPLPDAVIAGVDALVVVGFVAARYRVIQPVLLLPRVHAPHRLALLWMPLVVAGGLSAYFALLEQCGVRMISYTTDYVREGWPVWSMFLLLSVMPAVFEELAFRGVIQSAMEKVTGEREAWLLQAAMFSVLHLMPLIFPSHFAMGLLFGWVRCRTKSIYPGMLLHGLWNAHVLVRELVAS